MSPRETVLYDSWIASGESPRSKAATRLSSGTRVPMTTRRPASSLASGTGSGSIAAAVIAKHLLSQRTGETRSHVQGFRPRSRTEPLRGSEAEVAAGGHLERFQRPDVVLDEGLDAAVPGLGGDPHDARASQGRGGGVPGAQRMGGDPVGRQPGGLCAGLE